MVPPDQLSLAIGREGQNVRLAARLTGWKIDVKNSWIRSEAEDAAVAELIIQRVEEETLQKEAEQKLEAEQAERAAEDARLREPTSSWRRTRIWRRSIWKRYFICKDQTGEIKDNELNQIGEDPWYKNYLSCVSAFHAGKLTTGKSF